MFSVYILESEKAGKYYIGYSDNPERRLIEHNECLHSTFTSKHRPWKLMAQIPVSAVRSEAIAVEKYIKGRKSRNFIEAIISQHQDSDYIQKLIFLSSAG